MSTPIQQLAPSVNAYTFQFDVSLLVPLRTIYSTHLASMLKDHSSLLEGGELKQAVFNYPDCRFFSVSYGHAPLLWISNDNYATYLLFKQFFDSLNIDQAIRSLIDYDKDIVMYCGFFVVGDHLDSPLWHVDYFEGANAFTLITPLFDLEAQHGGLLYDIGENQYRRYAYKTGEAVFFGDKFSHTTEPYAKSNQRVLLSLTFGTDKTAYWPILEKTIGAQSRFMFLPCGHQAGTCECVELKYRANYVV